MTTMPFRPRTNPANELDPSCGWLRHVGILNDYVRIPYANGSSFASQFLYRELAKRGHQVTVVGPDDPEAVAEDLPPNHVLLDSVPLRNHPGVHLAMPSRQGLQSVRKRGFDLVLGQTCNALMQVGVYLRQTQRIPFLMVNTLHLPSAYVTLVPEFLEESKGVHHVFKEHLVPFAESQSALTYNQSDGLIVLSPGMKRYWRRMGVTVPIHVIPRAVEPKIFDRKPGDDPFPAGATKGGRLLVVCRHVREKSVPRLLEIFAKHVLPKRPDATLTLVGDGPDHEAFKAEAERLGVMDETFWLGERKQTEMVDFYAHADVFTYTSLSETYGQVISEALYCGAPVTAFADDMGVSGQVSSGDDGFLVEPGPDEAAGNAEFGAKVVQLLEDPLLRSSMSWEAKRRARRRGDPGQAIARYYDAFESARDHCHATAPMQRRRSEELVSVARWAGVQGIAYALGFLRPPAEVNRSHTRPPSWTLEGAATKLAEKVEAAKNAAA